LYCPKGAARADYLKGSNLIYVRNQE